MKLMRRIDYWLHRKQREAELAEELEFHRMHAGAPEFGNATLAREDARAVWIWPWIESVFQDLRYALRNMRRQPGFALVALLTLGIAIGLNTSLFSVFDAVALRRWPVKDPSRMVKLMAQPIGRGRVHGFSLAEFRYLNDHAKTLAGIVALNNERVRLGFESFGKTSGAMFVSANYFDVLGVPMDRGRGFLAEENDLDAPQPVAVLSYTTWRDHYAADPLILGKQIHVDEVPFTVVGVATEEFLGTTGGREDIWMPLAALQSIRPGNADTRAFLRNANRCCTPLAARLSPAVSQSQAQAELSVLSRQFHADNKLDAGTVLLAEATLIAGDPETNQFRSVFALMFAGVILVLLLACANVSNLLIARAAARQREIEIRCSVGAGRARIIRQLLTEGLLLATAAAVLGVLLAEKLPAYLFALAGDGLRLRLTPDFTVIFYAAGLAAIACIAFALAPALHGTRRGGARSRLSLRNVLLSAQVAMSVALLMGAGLMVAGVQHARAKDPGYRFSDISVISFELPASAYDAKRMLQFSDALSKEMTALPELRTVAMVAREPLTNSHWHTTFRMPGEPVSTEHLVEFLDVTAGYFDVLGIPLVAGRDFQQGDQARYAIIVNEAMTRRYFPNENALGKTIVTGTHTREIIGVARDAYLTNLDAVVPLFFEPFSGEDVPRVLVRSASAGSINTVGQIARRLEPRARTQSTALAANLDQELATARVGAGIAGALGIFALILASVGMAGVFAYVVQQRTKEIGIRMALGAEPKQVIQLVLSGTARAAIIGLTIGFLATAAFAKIMAQYLYGVSPYDPRAYFGVALILLFCGFAAAYLPARRATRIDPLNALRVE